MRLQALVTAEYGILYRSVPNALVTAGVRFAESIEKGAKSVVEGSATNVVNNPHSHQEPGEFLAITFISNQLFDMLAVFDAASGRPSPRTERMTRDPKLHALMYGHSGAGETPALHAGSVVWSIRDGVIHPDGQLRRTWEKLSK